MLYLYLTHCLLEVILSAHGGGALTVIGMWFHFLTFHGKSQRLSFLNVPGRQAVPSFRPPPWGPPVGKTRPPAPGASVSAGSLSLSPAGPVQLAPTPTSAPHHCCRLAGAPGPAGAQN